MDLVMVVVALIVLAVTAHWWGVDTTDGPLSAEWERRRQWGSAEAPARGRGLR